MNTNLTNVGRAAGRSYRFGKNMEYEITVARSLADRKRAWALVYRMYLAKGYAAADKDGLWYSTYDLLPQTTTFLVTRDGSDIATLTVVFDSEHGLPSDCLYQDELDGMRSNTRRMCEIVSLASEERDSKRGLEILKHMFRVALVLASRLSDATDFVITVNPHHSSYYENRLLFVQRGVIRSYDRVGGAPALFMVLDLVTLPHFYAARYGTAAGSLTHHFTDEQIVSDTVIFLSENIGIGNRHELLDWFRLNKPAVFERLNRTDKPFNQAGNTRLSAAAQFLHYAYA